MINISDSEWKIMNVLRERSPRTITELTKEFILYDTVHTFRYRICKFIFEVVRYLIPVIPDKSTQLFHFRKP